LNGIGFPSARISQMIEIIPSMPLPFHCNYAILVFSVTHINTIKNGNIEELAEQYKKIKDLLKSQFDYFLVAGSRPGKISELQKMRRITTQLQTLLAQDETFIVIDIFSDEKMLTEIYKKNDRDVIHFNETEAGLFQDRINDVIKNHRFKKVTRQERSKIQRIDKQKISIVGVANKILKKNNKTYTKQIYNEYAGRLFINNKEKNRHSSWNVNISVKMT
jgi:hypothetical protein